MTMRRFKMLGALAVVTVVAAGCGGSSSKSSSTSSSQSSSPTGTSSSAGTTANSGKVGGKLVIDNESGSTWTCQFNPFNPAVTLTSFGFVYESLQFVNILQSDKKPLPWLASSSTWSNGFKTLTFTIRDGIKWSDGQPFSAADVLFSFNLLKKHSALDLNADWSVLKSVKQSGANKVVFTFKTSAVPYFYYIASQTPIVPQHIWASV